MMSPPMELTHSNMAYIPTSDALERHEFAVTKHRKTASTGGGRAWSEDEEVYLLQTRLQKMPYKHIAAHLKKTELACRLHYHQLSHGSNRRKRTTSMSSGSSADHSPTIPVAAPSPIQETSRDITPPGSIGSYESDSYDHQTSMQLPSIVGRAGASSHLPAILPKPATMRPAVTACSSPSGFPTPLAEDLRNLGPSPFPQSSPMGQGGPSLRLDCSLPPPSAHVDMARLQAIYAQHRTSFWGVIAAEYGPGASPAVLERAWKSSMLSTGSHTPITPVTSPNDRDTPYERNSCDKTRISAILGIDANPRSPKEREMVRRLEEGRSVGIVTAA